jgi:hypothetical protein
MKKLAPALLALTLAASTVYAGDVTIGVAITHGRLHADSYELDRTWLLSTFIIMLALDLVAAWYVASTMAMRSFGVPVTLF